MTTIPRAARALVIGVIAAIAVPATVLAAPPEHAPGDPPPLLLAAGDACDFAVELSNPAYHARDTSFAPLPDGTTRFSERGMAASRATNIGTGATLDRRGGSAVLYRFAADGSIVARATGLVFAWYLPGDDSPLGPGLWLVNGRVTETYGTDGGFLHATFSGTAIDACAALAG
jgi:hypothetical protein